MLANQTSPSPTTGIFRQERYDLSVIFGTTQKSYLHFSVKGLIYAAAQTTADKYVYK